MPSTITLDYKPVALQGLSGTYGALELRRLVTRGPVAQEGVVGDETNAADFKVSPGAGLTLSVAHGEAYVHGDATANQGRYYCRGNGAAVANLSLVTAPDAVNPRIDQIVLEVKDDALDVSGLNEARLRVIPGTPTALADLNNRSGAAALPASCMRLADLLVPPSPFAGPFVAGTHIRDRRPWARGAYRRIVRNANAAGGNDYATANTTPALVDNVNLQPRIECSGVPLKMTASGTFGNGTAAAAVYLSPSIDGVADQTRQRSFDPSGLGYNTPISESWTLLPAAASHLFAPAYHAVSGQARFLARPGTGWDIELIIEELVRQNADNT